MRYNAVAPVVNNKYLMLKLQIMISLGFSPCPNDTFIFYALVHKKIDTRGLDFNFIIEDVETLNRLAVKKKIDVTKVSCHAYCRLLDEYSFLRAGGALGRGCGPLIVAKGPEKFTEGFAGELKVAIPGELTTAFLLLKLFAFSRHLQNLSYSAMPFYEIMGAVRDGRADAGLIIHEGRFTYQDYGLQRIIDLGAWWEHETGLPIPLGGIIARKTLGPSTVKVIEDLIRESVQYSLSHGDEAMPYIKHYAQELSGQVIAEHISLYVNGYTLDIGEDGMAALDELLNRAENTC